MMGMFNTVAPQGIAFRQRARRAQYEKRDLSDFAEALANGASIAAAGRIIGVSRQQAARHFQRICTELGEQAR